MITVAEESVTPPRRSCRQASSSAANDSIDGKRSRGSLISARATAAENGRDMAPEVEHARRRLVDVLHRDRDELSPLNGRRPVRSSKSTTPSE